jgi:predicted RNA-binding Zn ribbon-like protein
MIKVTWEWLGQGLALDLADTVTIEDDSERDLIVSGAEFSRWAEVEASVTGLPLDLLVRARTQLVDLRTALRQVLGAISAGEAPPRSAIARLNRASRDAPEWGELDVQTLELRRRSSARREVVLIGRYARSAMELIADQKASVRRCGAPSCGMFYVATRAAQRWCSTQCGSRARVARHYSRVKSAPRSLSGHS